MQHDPAIAPDLPDWYMPAPGATRLRGWRRIVALVIIVALVVVVSMGLCVTYGWTQIA